MKYGARQSLENKLRKWYLEDPAKWDQVYKEQEALTDYILEIDPR